MQLQDLNAQSPQYDAETWLKYHSLYRGGKTFRDNIELFLPQNDMEPAPTYAKRKRESCYRSYVGPIVDFFSAQLMSAKFGLRAKSLDDDNIVGEPDPFYTLLKEDVDGIGTDLVDFMRARFTTSVVKGSAWWLVEMPNDGGVSPESRAEWTERNLGRGRIGAIEPECVLDWECDEIGQLLWVIVAGESSPRRDPRASRDTIRKTWRVYDRTHVETFEIAHKRGEVLRPDQEIPSVSYAPHGFSQVPIVKMSVPDGLWIVDRVADAQVEHFRLSSGLGWAIRRTCYAILVLKSKDKASPPTMGLHFTTIDVDEAFEWCAPGSESFKVIGDEIKSQKDEIYRVAQQMALGVDNNAAAVGRSAESKSQDSGATEVCLVAYGAVVREAIEKTYDLMASARGDAYHWSVEGFDSFNLASASIALENAANAIALSIPSETLRKELYVDAAYATLPNLDQSTKDVIRAEIEAGVHLESEMRSLMDSAPERDESETPMGEPPAKPDESGDDEDE